MNRPLQHILCVDDEPDILQVATMCLETVGGFTVTSLSSGIKATAEAISIKPDLILLDVMMPEMDGPATLKILRKNPALDHIPIVFMTARVQPQDIEEYMKLGAAAVIQKPFDPMSIAGEISEIWKKLLVN